MENDTPKIKIAVRILLGGLVAAGVWYAGLLLVFGPAQSILADPAYQSRKFLEVFTHLEPMPRMFTQPAAFYGGFWLVGIAFSAAYHLAGNWIPGSPTRKGFLFGCLAWLLMNPWFEFYLPWNVMHEPILLVLLEMVLWFVVLLITGMATAYSHLFLARRKL